VDFAFDPSSTFDAFSAKFMGSESVHHNKQEYQVELGNGFTTNYRKFLINEKDVHSLSECVRITKQREDITMLPIPSSSVADSLDAELTDCICVYAAAYNTHTKRLNPYDRCDKAGKLIWNDLL
jgi:hypothetical protein